MSYQCPTCGQEASCWSPSIHKFPAKPMNIPECYQKLLKLTDELCDSVDAGAADVGGHRSALTILGELGPVVEECRSATPPPQPKEAEVVKPDGYDYVYLNAVGNEVIVRNNAEQWNGQQPIRAMPYYYTPPASQAVGGRDGENREQTAMWVNLGCAIERAARDLPDGWSITIDVERGCGTVSGLINPERNFVAYEFPSGGLTAEIYAAIDAAMLNGERGKV